ncbi:hypothetical protein P43SY_001992 [Pythium insidiosum]|uniref:RING-type E3 ubiquitin transferase n=1 Tax=Pythium insidiosum TaxID=114742 RepID=A0AAD5Q7F3_PYTIN|nr:hypothetical protein P43SY_001992 [Pythium insidiosum]
MDRGENRVVMIVRASPRLAGGNGARPAFPNDAVALNLGAMDAAAEWRQQQFQRQRMQMLSMAIFLCFMVLFFDNRANDARHMSRNSNGNSNSNSRLHSPSADANRYALGNETERKAAVRDFQSLLQAREGYDAHAPSSNISGIYSGTWESMSAEQYEALRPKDTDIIPYLKIDRDIQMQQITQPVEQGHTWLLLKMKAPAVKEVVDDVAYVKGQLVIYEEEASLAATILPVQGVFLRKLGKLTLFGNSPDSTVQLLYKKQAAALETSAAPTASPSDASKAAANDRSEDLFRPRLRLPNGMALGVVDGIPTIENRDEYDAIDISPPRYAYVSRFRSTDSFSDQCVSVIEMALTQNATNVPLGTPPGKLLPKSSKLTGTIASVNCGVYLKIETTFEEENLNEFFSKASHYAVIMTFIAMAEIYVLLRQLQITNTQATAAKVSLLTIGQQAIVDSYLCLGHLTVGIVAQNVFTAFASVAFVKLIIFSVFEMRYLLIIWKARRPQGFSDGWLTLRRELTTLYSRFYLSLLAGLAIIYNFSSQLPVLVFLGYSFWVPQIVHNVHREVRNPFDTGYLYGISALRMFLPLYFYGCPTNFLSAFPMYDSKTNPTFCYVLTVWMALQVLVLVLQQRLGPRFFVPARFLPVKYNYERRIDAQQLSLLRTSTNDDGGVDCVICMVELDVSARDYMIAPCDHIFHRECLQGWMQVKMECPTCRCALPEP